MNEIMDTIEKGSVYAIIPARSGSKGIVNKNIKEMAGYPLIAYSVAAAKMSKRISRTIVSTNSEVYADVAKKYGAEVPFLRPEEISGDKSVDIEFMQHAIMKMYELEGIIPEYWVHLRTTTPLREDGIIDCAIHMFEQNPEYTSLLSVNEPTDILTPYKWLKKEGDELKSLFFDKVDDANLPRQSYPSAFIRTDIVDILRSDTILKTNTMYGNKVLACVTDYAYDIDDEKSFAKCNSLLCNEKYQYLLTYLRKSIEM